MTSTKIIPIITILISIIGCKSIGYSQDSVFSNKILIDNEFYDSLKEKVNIAKNTFIKNEKISFKKKYGRDSIAINHHSHSEIAKSLVNSLKKQKYFKNKKYVSLDIVEMTLSGEMVSTEVYFLFRRDFEKNDFDILKFKSNPNGFDKEFIKKNVSNIFEYTLLHEFIQDIKPDYDKDCHSTSYVMKIHFTTIIRENNELITQSKVLNHPCNYHFEMLDKFFFKDFENY